MGLIPGWGGSTLTPRLIGPEKALELIVYNPMNQNRMLDGAKAFHMGLADRLFDSVEFFDESLAFLEDMIEGKVKIERKAARHVQTEDQFDAARNFLDMRVHGAAPAPYRALDLIQERLRP